MYQYLNMSQHCTITNAPVKFTVDKVPAAPSTISTSGLI